MLQIPMVRGLASALGQAVPQSDHFIDAEIESDDTIPYVDDDDAADDDVERIARLPHMWAQLFKTLIKLTQDKVKSWVKFLNPGLVNPWL